MADRIQITTPVIPVHQTFIGDKKTLDLRAICVFAATGFFLDQDSYYTEQKVLKPATDYILNGDLIESEASYFKWHYSPVERSLNKITEEFAALFESIIQEQVENKKVILPLSGGLDSRTQAAALFALKKQVTAYSYAFEGGIQETSFSKKIAQECAFPFHDWRIPQGYLLPRIEQLARINSCYADFTHPRQFAFLDQFQSLGDVFSLGHWGDVLFDDMGIADSASHETQLQLVLKKITKKGGMELAESLWQNWGLKGDFKNYFTERVDELLTAIPINHSANARIRAFKSLYWAPRWTSINLSVFEKARPITLPYYDNRMCAFICGVPEKYLAGRQIQIEYLKMRMPSLARIPWQDHRPFNLYTYPMDKSPWNIPFRVIDKFRRTLSDRKFILRNWELQFLGDENDRLLKHWLFENRHLNEFISPAVMKEFYSKFKSGNPITYSHPVSLLLTLSLFQHLRTNG